MSPLARDIVVVLAVKAIALAVLWVAFFRAPPSEPTAVDARRVEQRVLTPDSDPSHAHR